MNTRIRSAIIAVLATVICLATARQVAAADRPRLLVLTDIGGDPDDQQSMIRLMLYANEFEIAGLIATAAGTPGELKEAVTRPDLIRQIMEAYGRVRDNLAKHAAGYPQTSELLARITSGNPHRGQDFIGEAHDTDGSRWIVTAADRNDQRPLNIVIWGGQTDLAQALWRVRNDRGETGFKKFLARIRVYDIDDQDGIHAWILENFPDLFYVLAKSAPGKDKRTGAYRGMYLGGDESLTSREWVEQHVRTGHGPLGALYPTETWTAPNPHSTLKEGDTPSWFFFLPTGLGDPAHPDWGSWGGRFGNVRAGLWRDANDTVRDTTDARTTAWRWRPEFQADFQARMDWCVQPYDDANHPPVVLLNGQNGHAAVEIQAAAGERIRLSTEGSSDPDGDPLSYHWFVYREVGSYSGMAAIDNSAASAVLPTVPADASGETFHVIVAARDNGQPSLTRYRRAVVHVAARGQN